MLVNCRCVTVARTAIVASGDSRETNLLRTHSSECRAVLIRRETQRMQPLCVYWDLHARCFRISNCV